jgi:hypothetical protein
LTLEYDTDTQKDFPLHLLLPTHFSPGQLYLDGMPLDWELVELAQDTYVKTQLPGGHHQLIVEKQ